MSKRALAFLPARLLSEVRVEAPKDLPKPSGRLQKIWRAVGNSHKWLHYFETYEKVFSPYVGTSVRLLEIGVLRGGSLHMWKKYFGDASTIVGVDIDPSCRIHDEPENGVHVRIGSQVDPDFLTSVVREFGLFDIVIDDGSHLSSHMVISFGLLFESGLADNGVYIVEDTHATYWSSHRDVPFAFSDFCRDLIDLMHAHYWTASGAQQFSLEPSERLSEVTVPKLATLVDRIEVQDSIVTIHKGSGPKVLPVNLVL